MRTEIRPEKRQIQTKYQKLSLKSAQLSKNHLKYNLWKRTPLLLRSKLPNIVTNFIVVHSGAPKINFWSEQKYWISARVITWIITWWVIDNDSLMTYNVSFLDVKVRKRVTQDLGTNQIPLKNNIYQNTSFVLSQISH